MMAAEAVKNAADRAAFDGAGGIRGHASASASGFPNPLLQGGGLPAEEEVVAVSDGDKVPGSMEAASGGSPETIVHDETALSEGDDLSPEEEAVHGTVNVPDTSGDDEADAAGLAEGRVQPPVSSGD
jgi:hypothetical protein